jgi:exosortase
MDNLMTGTRAARAEKTVWQGVAAIVAFALMILLYKDTFVDWWLLWIEPGSFYAHAAFVPFFVALMIWRNREKLAAARWKPSWTGLLLIIPAMVFLIMGKQAGVTVVKSLSFLGFLLGASLLFLGTARTRILLFPMLFIVAMIPLFPDQLINVIAFPIQLKSTQIATSLLNVLQLPAVREGTMIQMENYKMAVEGACSGFKTLVSLLTFAAAFAYLVEGALWKRWLLFLITGPLSLLINGLRITFIGIVGQLFSAKAAATFHDYSGFIVLLLAFTVLFNLARLLRCESFLGVPLDDEPAKDGKAGEPVAPAAGPPERAGSFTNQTEDNAPAGSEPVWWQEVLTWRPTGYQLRRALPYVLAVNLVMLTTLAVQGRVLVKRPPEFPIATFQVPMTLNANGVTWSANTKDPMVDKLSPSIQDQLKPTRVINRDYTGSDGAQVSLFVTAGNARWTFHDPHNCSLGSAAILNDVGILDVPTSHGTLKVLECRFQDGVKSPEYELMYFYVVKGDVLQRTEQVHKRLVLQTFLGDDGKPSYFLRFTQRTAGTDETRRDQLKRFVAAMWDQISPVMEGQVAAQKEAPPTPAPEH